MTRTSPLRERLSMDFGWKFHLGDIPAPSSASHGEAYMNVKAGEAGSGAKPDFDDSAWRTVDVPHDWAVEGSFAPEHNLSHGYLPAGISATAAVGWYRKTFLLPPEDSGRRLRVEFDGVFRNCTVWLNGFRLGNNLSGYTSFAYDVTDAANCGGENVLSVRVDASAFEGWWYEGAGIYRHVWLVKTDPLAVAHWGTFVRAELLDSGDRFVSHDAVLTIETTVANEHDRDADCELVSEIIAPDGNAVATVRSQARLAAGERHDFAQTAAVPQPALWSVDSPNLYRLRTIVKGDPQGSHTGDPEGPTAAVARAVDEYSTTFGIRSVRFDPDQGFFLNGKPLKLKGTCNHQDHAGVGVAVPDRINEFRIQRLKEMGSNAYRCAHNPPTPELLDACDRLGMLVMDENRILGSSPEVLGQLDSLVRRDRNHPCVIIWSLANEEPAQGTEAGARIAATMKRLVRRLDPSRPVTMAMNGAWGSPTSAVLDVQGCNYFIDGYDDYHRRFPRHPMVGSETASTVSTRGIYANDAAVAATAQKGYVSAYDVNSPGWGATAERAGGQSPTDPSWPAPSSGPASTTAASRPPTPGPASTRTSASSTSADSRRTTSTTTARGGLIARCSTFCPTGTGPAAKARKSTSGATATAKKWNCC